MIYFAKYIIISLIYFIAIALFLISLKRYPIIRKKLKFNLIILTFLLLIFNALLILNIPLPPNYSLYIEVILYIGIFFSLIRISSVLIFDLVAERKGKIKFPKLLRDLANLIAYTIVFLIVTNVLLKWDITPVLATSAVVTLILGLALQDTLGNFFSGLAIHFEPPFQIGDWIKTGEIIGRVGEITWRSVKIITRHNDTIIIPNSVIAKEVIINYSRPSDLHAHSVKIGIDYEIPPEKVAKVIENILYDIEEVDKYKKPIIKIIAYQDFSILYEIKFWYKDYANIEMLEAEINKRIWYAFKRESIVIPFPIRNIHIREEKKVELGLEEVINSLKGIFLFQEMEDDEIKEIAGTIKLKKYLPGEIIVKQGDEGGSMYVIKSGILSVEIKTATGQSRWVKDLIQNDFFGEISLLTGEKRTATIKAKTSAEIYELQANELKGIIKNNPKIAEKLNLIIEKRKEEMLKAIEDETLEIDESIKDEKFLSIFINKIKNFLFK